MNRHFARVIASLLVCALSAGIVSCGGAEAGSDTSAADDTSAPIEETTADPYPLDGYDFGGADFTILNVENVWNMNTYLDYESQSGEILADAIYNRDRRLEEKLNFKLKTVEAGIYDLVTAIQTEVAAGDHNYDAAYCAGHQVGGLISQGYLMNLFDIPELQLDKPWWNQITVNASIIGNNERIYFAQSNLSLTAFDLAWCLYFNEDMMDDLKLDKPYDLVREGKWTLDKFSEYQKKSASLNGDDGYEFKDDGKSRYGYTTYYNGAMAMMVSAGLTFTTKDSKGLPVFNMESERFVNVCTKLAQMFGTEGSFMEGETGNKPKTYQNIFKNRRALFVGGEVKASGELRDFADTFGMLPMPKYDENQENYQTWTNYLAPVLTVPVTVTEPSRTGVIIDALSYYSYLDVLPVYYDITVSQKGLRNDDSIEMLGIINESLCFDPSLAYGWTTKLAEKVRDLLIKGDTEFASTVASGKSAVEESIKKMMDSFK